MSGPQSWDAANWNSAPHQCSSQIFSVYFMTGHHSVNEEAGGGGHFTAQCPLAAQRLGDRRPGFPSQSCLATAVWL